MRGYGKRLISRAREKGLRDHAETRDAILWDVLDDQRIARVKIQGSSTLIIAHYPANWERRPIWLKPGNAVKILHTSGIRGRVELIGHGHSIPTPVEGDTFPPLIEGGDTVLTGCRIFALDPPLMVVGITAGTYRIDGVLYYLGGYGGVSGPFPLGEVPTMEMGVRIPMGTIGAFGVSIDAAPSTPGNYRYDLIVVGIDGDVHAVKGTEFTDEPIIPEVPDDHVECGKVLLYYGMSAVTAEYIDREWIAPFPATLQITYADQVLGGHFVGEVCVLTETSTISVTVYNQYGFPMNPPASRPYWLISLEKLSGEGTISPAPYHVTHGATCSFTYERGDVSPILKATLLNADNPIYCLGWLMLVDCNNVGLHFDPPTGPVLPT